MIVVFTAEAEADLEAIGDYIAAHNPARALSFIQELRAACQILSETPKAFPLIPRFEGQGVRRRVFGDYLIFYTLEPDRVVIVHIAHGARDYAALLFPE